MPKTPAPPAEITLSSARQALKQALEAAERAKSLQAKSEKVVDAASAAVEQARADVATFDDLDKESVRSRLAELVGQPGEKTKEEIREARRQRTIAQEELDSAKEALQVAQKDLEESRGNVDRAQKVCASHATSVLSEKTTEVLAEWSKVNEEWARLHTILQSLILVPVPLELYQEEQRSNILHSATQGAGLPFGDWRDWHHLQRKIGEALALRYEPHDPAPGISKARAYWGQFSDAVLADPAAEPAPLPSATELWG